MEGGSESDNPVASQSVIEEKNNENRQDKTQVDRKDVLPVQKTATIKWNKTLQIRHLTFF
jgi:hypothetical protein